MSSFHNITTGLSLTASCLSFFPFPSVAQKGTAKQNPKLHSYFRLHKNNCAESTQQITAVLTRKLLGIIFLFKRNFIWSIFLIVLSLDLSFPKQAYNIEVYKYTVINF